MGTVREFLAESTKGAPQLGSERSRVYSDLTPEEKDRYNADIRATNILLQGLPKDIYTLINHYTDVKDIWDNVKMLLKGSELTKEDRESQLEAQNRVGNVNSGQARPVKCYNCNGGQDNAFDDDVDEQHVQDLALNVPDHEHYQDAACAHHEGHVMHDSYVKDNEVPLVHSDASSVPTDAFMM
nr:integrase, catalytic region, zinc finger, CCHC-type, peptidase aspartic, catalytic [Tanacetum cinerariifolium]